MGCGCNGLGGNGFGAYFKDSTFHTPHVNRAASVTRAGRVVGMDRLGRAIATDGFGAYYLAVPGQMFSGFGAWTCSSCQNQTGTPLPTPLPPQQPPPLPPQQPLPTCGPGVPYPCLTPKTGHSGFGAAQAFAFDSAAVWSDWVAGATGCDYSSSQNLCVIKAKRAVNSIRAALGELGYGTSVMSVSWSSADQANYKQWAADSNQTSSNGMPEKSHLQLMEQQISQGMKPGPEAAVSYVKVGNEIVEGGSALLQKAKGLGWKVWALIGAAAVVGVVIYKKRKGKQYTSYKKTTAIEPYRGGQMQPAYATNPGHHWPKQTKAKVIRSQLRQGRSLAQAEAFYRLYRGQQARQRRGQLSYDENGRKGRRSRKHGR